MSVPSFMRKNSPSRAAKAGARPTHAFGDLHVRERDDRLEHEADRVAEAITTGQRARRDWSLSRVSVDTTSQERGVADIPERKNPDAFEVVAPPIVHDVLASPGQPLDEPTRSFFEPRFGQDFSEVRVHSDETAAASASAIKASAYTAGHDLAFATGRYAPETMDGQLLLAHELSHVVQQDGREAALGVENFSREPMPFIQRAADDEWNKDYDKHKSYLQKPYEEFKGGLGEVRPTTKGGLSENVGRPITSHTGAGRRAAPEITMPVLKEIYPGLANDVAADPAKETKAKAYLDSLNEAFRIMKIDTVEAQANYLSHAFVESDQFRQFTESQGAVDAGAQKWMDDPTKVKIDPASLAKQGELYAKGKDINPHGKYEFIGRGPVQVTHQPEYVETIAMLEKTAEQYDKQPGGNPQAKASAELAREAAAAVKADPRQAANPKYTFLFSAAFMKKKGADVSVAYQSPGAQWVGDDPASSWVAGRRQKEGSPQAKALIDKRTAYQHIYSVLLREAKAASPKP